MSAGEIRVWTITYLLVGLAVGFLLGRRSEAVALVECTQAHNVYQCQTVAVPVTEPAK